MIFSNEITLYLERFCIKKRAYVSFIQTILMDCIFLFYFSCPPQNQILAEGQCCKTCQADFCSRGPRDCHPELAVCVNGLQNYTCHCKQGFKGDGKYCEGMTIFD